MNSNNFYVNAFDLTKSLEITLAFIQGETAIKDVDLLITVQSFIQNITIHLEKHLDLGIYFNLSEEITVIILILFNLIVINRLIFHFDKNDNLINESFTDIMLFWMKITSVLVIKYF